MPSILIHWHHYDLIASVIFLMLTNFHINLLISIIISDFYEIKIWIFFEMVFMQVLFTFEFAILRLYTFYFFTSDFLIRSKKAISKTVKSKFVWMKLFNIIHREKYCILKQTVQISLKNNYDENGLPSTALLLLLEQILVYKVYLQI